MRKNTDLPTPPRPKLGLADAVQQREFNEAVERVYRRYGSDLSAFLRDVKIELTKRDSSAD
ncbi:MAG TPA: hypothetical protein VJB15_05720 [Rhodothermia bacterium]|nr:hypothetical protein [Rhodothermia bacterium]